MRKPNAITAQRRTCGRLALAFAVVAGAASVLVIPDPASAAPNAAPTVTQFDLVSPLPNSQSFGSEVLLLSNGNYVVADPRWDDGATIDVGAVFLFDGATDTLISTLTGSTQSDQIGSDGIFEVGDSNFVVVSLGWDDGAVSDVGAVTFGSGTAGVSGPVSTSNSLHGTTADDHVANIGVTVLTNGNYTIASSIWHNGAGVRVGAVTFADGTTGITGAVTPTNSLHGTETSDQVGNGGVTALTNGNYTVNSPSWGNGVIGAGAVTFANGTTGITGPVTVANSLHGTMNANQVGFDGVTPLANGNYVVNSANWDNGAASNVGAVTLGDGTTGITGPVTVSNSLHGTMNNRIADGGVTALTNGNYVVSSILWDDGPAIDVGAVTFANGSTGITGPVTTSNSLHGTTNDDRIGFPGVTPLLNGSYTVESVSWDDGLTPNVGAVTFADGTTGLTGPVTTADSLHGTTTNDFVGNGGVTTLTNGNYVVTSPFWDDGAATEAGAVTFASGTSGITGPVTTANSLHGTTMNDFVGFFGVTALTTGNYVVNSAAWDSPETVDAGAATFADGTTGLAGPVSVANSLHGSTVSDNVAGSGITALPNGNYAVASSSWDDVALGNVGAVTFADGATGITGPVTPANSLHGTAIDEFIGSGGVTALVDGNYAVVSPSRDDGPAINAGAVTFGLGESGAVGPVTSTNSVIGTPPGQIDPPGDRYTTNDAIVVPTEQNRVLLMRVDRAPFFSSTPPDVSASTPPGGSAATVMFPNPIASDVRDVAEPPVACSPASGTVFAVGTTTVTCTATDTVGLTATTSLTVTVNATPTPAAAAITSSRPGRFVDTRPSGETLDDLFEKTGRRVADSEYEVQISGRGSVPVGARAVVANITAVAADGIGFVTAHPCLTPRPNASSLNYTAGVNIANEVIIPLTGSGELCLYTSAAAHLLVDVTGHIGAASTTTPVAPARYLDTRPTGDTFDDQKQAEGRPPAGATITLPVAGRGDVPADAAAVIVNVTAINADNTGFVTVHPCLPTAPNAASLNYVRGVNRANELIAQVDPSGNICLFTSASAHLAADVVGYLPAGTAVTNITPSRLVDTRPTGDTVDDQNQAEGRRPADTQTRIQVTGRAGVPATATTAVLYITAVQPDGIGFVTVHPCAATRPNVSSLNHVPGVNGGNEIITRLDAGGGICVYTSATTHITIDAVAHTT